MVIVQMLAGFESRTYKVAMLEKIFRGNYLKYSQLFYIAKASSKQFFIFFFVLRFSFLKLLQWKLLQLQVSQSS